MTAAATSQLYPPAARGPEYGSFACRHDYGLEIPGELHSGGLCELPEIIQET
jgi:hypothetical protein